MTPNNHQIKKRIRKRTLEDLRPLVRKGAYRVGPHAARHAQCEGFFERDIGGSCLIRQRTFALHPGRTPLGARFYSPESGGRDSATRGARVRPTWPRRHGHGPSFLKTPTRAVSRTAFSRAATL